MSNLIQPVHHWPIQCSQTLNKTFKREPVQPRKKIEPCDNMINSARLYHIITLESILEFFIILFGMQANISQRNHTRAINPET